MISAILLAAASMASPIEARLVEVDLQRVPGVAPSWYNRVHVDLASPVARQVRICPRQASVSTARRVDSGMRPVGTYRAYAMNLGGAGSYATGCRDLTLAPGRPQRVTFFVREVPGSWRGEDLYTFDLDAGETQMRFVAP